ncbi:hypothetical protein [Sporosarcina sp. FSL W7-1283]|uniref:hypothetical protein n=1 Tax=Sporosarcina sp. FSL W7-1283 TaxID=2921560 RepID=UPI0030F7A149
MVLDSFEFDELDLELVFYIRDELEKLLGNKATEVLMKSTLLPLLQSDPLYVHHYDEKYWAEQIYLNYHRETKE